MQPYLFPYIGYYQLVHSVDTFIFYDDVTFIKQGWIARNQILVNGNPLFFSVNLQDLSSSRTINETYIHPKLYPVWRSKFYKTLRINYGKAPFFKPTMRLIESILEMDHLTISNLSAQSVLKVSEFLGLKPDFKFSSECNDNSQGKGTDRILNICKKESADVYINLPGGKKLYDKYVFVNQGIDLKFIKPGTIDYKQTGDTFVPNLSIIDVLMFNEGEYVKDCFIPNYNLE